MQEDKFGVGEFFDKRLKVDGRGRREVDIIIAEACVKLDCIEGYI
jgi:hypothetical protein